MNEVMVQNVDRIPSAAVRRPSRAQKQAGFDLARERSAKILAKSFYRELKGNGYTHEQILALSTELIGLVTSDIDGSAPEQAPVGQLAPTLL